MSNPVSPHTRTAVQAVLAERERQIAKWGHQTHPEHLWHLILAEEVGEVAKEVNEIYFRQANKDGYAAEMIQVAAVALAALEDYYGRN